MTINVNGEAYAWDDVDPLTVPEVLERLGMSDKPVVVELNARALLPQEWSDCRVSDGDRLEIVVLVAGG